MNPDDGTEEPDPGLLSRAGLDGQDWLSRTAQSIYQIVQDYQQGTLEPEDMPTGMQCPLEAYARTRGGKDGAGILYLSMLSGAGAVTQGGTWVAWEGKPNNVQVSPCVLHVYGTARSGTGKSEQLKKVADVVIPAFARGNDALMSASLRWLTQARDNIDAAFAALVAKHPEYSNDPEKGKEFTRAKSAAHRAVSSISSYFANPLNSFKDSTAESLIVDTIANGCGYIVSAEQDILDNLIRYSASGVSGSLSAFTEGWDGADYARNRRGSGAVKTEALCMSVTLLTQTASFAEGLSNGGQWLSKGMLGRGWVVGFPDMTPEEVFAEAVKSVTFTDGLVDKLKEAFSRIAEENGEARAMRMIENNMGTLVTKVIDDPSEFTEAILSSINQYPRAVTAQSIRSTGSSGTPAGVGMVRWVSKSDAQALERLFVWMKASNTFHGWLQSSEDSVLWPLLSRLTHHIARIASLREMVWMACASDEKWQEWLAADKPVDHDILVDTAARMIPWLVRTHLLTLGSIVNVSSGEQIRGKLVQSRGQDVSLMGQIANAVKAMGGEEKLQAVQGMSISDLAKTVSARVAGETGTTVHQMRTAIIAALKKDAEAGPDQSGYFVYSKGRKVGSVLVMGFGPETSARAGEKFVHLPGSSMAAHPNAVQL